MKAVKIISAFPSRCNSLAHTTKYMSASKRLKLSTMAPPKQSTGSNIVRFYDPDIQAKDALGRTQEQILEWSNNQLENSHNYIQMLFPLPEGSPYNWEAPVIDSETMKAFRANIGLRQRLRRSFERMLTFYGFTTSFHPEVSEVKKDVVVDKLEQQEQETTAGPPEDKEEATTQSPKTTPTTGPPPADAAPPKPKSTSQSPFGYYVVRGPNWRRASRNWCVRMDHNHLRITRILRCLRVLGLQTECDAFFAALKRVHADPAVSIGDRSMEYWTRAVERPLYIAPDNDKIEWLKTWEAEQEKDQ